MARKKNGKAKAAPKLSRAETARRAYRSNAGTNAAAKLARKAASNAKA